MNIIDLKLEIHEAYMNHQITESQRDFLLEAADNKYKAPDPISIPSLPFIQGKVTYYGDKEFLENKDLINKIKREWTKVSSGARKYLEPLMEEWDLPKLGVKNYADLQRYMHLDSLDIHRFNYDGGGYGVTIWYNSQNKHASEQFFAHHSFTVNMDIYDKKPAEISYQLEG